MRTDLKSLMILAHEVKARYMITMREAMRIAWAKAKGFTHFACISVVKEGKLFKREYLFAFNSGDADAARIAYVKEIARLRAYPTLSPLNVLGEHVSRI